MISVIRTARRSVLTIFPDGHCLNIIDVQSDREVHFDWLAVAGDVLCTITRGKLFFYSLKIAYLIKKRPR
jgi:hypothetical protein